MTDGPLIVTPTVVSWLWRWMSAGWMGKESIRRELPSVVPVLERIESNLAGLPRLSVQHQLQWKDQAKQITAAAIAEGLVFDRKAVKRFVKVCVEWLIGPGYFPIEDRVQKELETAMQRGEYLASRPAFQKIAPVLLATAPEIPRRLPLGVAEKVADETFYSEQSVKAVAHDLRLGRRPDPEPEAEFVAQSPTEAEPEAAAPSPAAAQCLVHSSGEGTNCCADAARLSAEVTRLQAVVEELRPKAGKCDRLERELQEKRDAFTDLERRLFDLLPESRRVSTGLFDEFREYVEILQRQHTELEAELAEERKQGRKAQLERENTELKSARDKSAQVFEALWMLLPEERLTGEDIDIVFNRYVRESERLKADLLDLVPASIADPEASPLELVRRLVKRHQQSAEVWTEFTVALVALGIHDPERAPGDVAIGEIQRLRGDLAALRSEGRPQETAIAPVEPEIPHASNGAHRGTGEPVRHPLLFPADRQLSKEERVQSLQLAANGYAGAINPEDAVTRLQQLDLATHVLWTALAE